MKQTKAIRARGRILRKKGVDYCRHCNKTNCPLIKESKHSNGRMSYTCRKCLTKRAGKYRSTPEGKAKIYACIARYYKLHKDRAHARSLLNMAVKSGKIIKPKKCEKCNKRKKVFGHHPDYKKPLDVIWCCMDCHREIENKLKKKNVSK